MKLPFLAWWKKKRSNKRDSSADAAEEERNFHRQAERDYHGSTNFDRSQRLSNLPCANRPIALAGGDDFMLAHPSEDFSRDFAARRASLNRHAPLGGSADFDRTEAQDQVGALHVHPREIPSAKPAPSSRVMASQSPINVAAKPTTGNDIAAPTALVHSPSQLDSAVSSLTSDDISSIKTNGSSSRGPNGSTTSSSGSRRHGKRVTPAVVATTSKWAPRVPSESQPMRRTRPAGL